MGCCEISVARTLGGKTRGFEKEDSSPSLLAASSIGLGWRGLYVLQSPISVFFVVVVVFFCCFFLFFCVFLCVFLLLLFFGLLLFVCVCVVVVVVISPCSVVAIRL